jgi:hypothetical protein
MNDPDFDLRPRSAEAPIPPARRRARWPWLILALLLVAALVVGLAAWLDPATRGRLAGAVQPAPATSPATVVGPDSTEDLKARIAALESALANARDAAAPPVNTPAQPMGSSETLEARVAALEAQAAALRAAEAASASRLDQLASGLAAASGAAAEADRQMMDLLLLAVSRRHLEQGRPFGRLSDVLDARFRGTDAAAVDALNAWAAAPQTRALLATRLDALSLKPEADRPAPDAGFWQRLGERLSRLITVRERGSGAVLDRNLLSTAREALDAGDIGLAIARVEQLPPGPGRDAWLADAALLLAAERGLDRLETQLLAAVVARESMALAPPQAVPAG